MTHLDEWISVVAAAKRFNTSSQAIRRLVKLGVVPGRRDQEAEAQGIWPIWTFVQVDSLDEWFGEAARANMCGGFAQRHDRLRGSRRSPSQGCSSTIWSGAKRVSGEPRSSPEDRSCNYREAGRMVSMSYVAQMRCSAERRSLGWERGVPGIRQAG